MAHIKGTDETAPVPARSVFVGRAAERRALTAALESSTAGHGRLVMLAGEPGIGKTRLGDEIAGEARAAGVLVAWGRCWEGGGAPAFWPWVQILRKCVQEFGESAREIAGAAADQIAALVPEFADPNVAGTATVPDAPALSAALSDEAQIRLFRLFDAITGFLIRAARRRPTLIILDDCHAADEASLLLTQFIARSLADAPIMIVATYREVEVRRSLRMSEIVTDLGRQGETIPVGGLDTGEVRQFVEEVSGCALGTDGAAVLHRTTEGNPFFLGEIVRLIAAQGRIDSIGTAGAGSFEIPDGVRVTIRRRVAMASKQAGNVLAHAAVIGREFESDLAARLCGLDHAQALVALDEAASLGLLSGVAGAPGRYRFSHALVSETLYKDLPAARRRELHLAAAQAIEENVAADPDARLDEIAHHYFESLPAGPAVKAIEFSRRAAARSRAALAYADAARSSAMALRAFDLDRRADPALRCELELELGEAQFRSQKFAVYRKTFDDAARLAREIRNPRLLARAALGYAVVPSNPGAVDVTVAALLEEALSALGESPSELRVMLLARLAEEVLWSGDTGRQGALSSQALETARALGLPRATATALYSRYHALRSPDAIETRLGLSDEILAVTQRHGLEDWALRARYYRTADLLEMGETAAAFREVQALAELDESVRLQHPGFVEVAAAMRALMEGRFADAERLATEAFTIGQRRPNMVAQQIFASQMFVLRREQGRLGELEPVIQTFVTQFPALIFARCALALCHAEAGRTSDAAAAIERLAAEEFGAMRRDFTWLACMATVAEVCAITADTRHGQIVRRALQPFAARNVTVGAQLCLGSAARYLGMLAALMGDYGDAQARFEDAIAMNARMGARPWHAHAQFELGAMLLGRGNPDDRERALELIGAARESAASLGMIRLARKIDELPTAPSAQPAGVAPTETASAESRSLFRKEGEFWTVAHKGRVHRLKDTKGMTYLATLLRNPGREYHALDLVAGVSAAGADAPSGGASAVGAMTDDQLDEIGLRRSDGDDAGEVLDAQAKAEYRRRLEELHDELEEARELSDPERADRAQEEIESLGRELARAVGIGGRSRRVGATSERARLNATRAIKAALDRINDADSVLGEVLISSIKTGTFCSYSPDPASPISWTF
jgi:tetratricopeptide (TPR) repeat protein